MRKIIKFLAVRDAAMVGMINNIASMGTPIPGLTQNDDDVPYCSAENLPADCVNQTVCHCPHLVQLDTCKVYEFFLYDAGGTASVGLIELLLKNQYSC